MQTDRLDCAICAEPLAAWRAASSVLCESPTCAFRLAALPAHEKCLVCTRPVPPQLRAERHCGGARCRHAVMQARPTAAWRQARAALLATAPVYQADTAAAQGLSAEDGRSYALSVIPKNPDRVKRLPRKRREAFEASLRRHLAGARQRVSDDAANSPPATEVPTETAATSRQRAVAAVLGAGCGACRGTCCRTGADHAYQGEDSLVRYVRQHPDRTDDAIIADYLGYLPTMSLSEGCVYQRDDGCALPRDMRADICNNFYCTGLKSIRSLYEDGRPVRAFFVHYDGSSLHGGQFVEMPDGAD